MLPMPPRIVEAVGLGGLVPLRGVVGLYGLQVVPLDSMRRCPLSHV